MVESWIEIKLKFVGFLMWAFCKKNSGFAVGFICIQRIKYKKSYKSLGLCNGEKGDYG